jgi:peptidoglycan/xylan/chitin deacetylase (PgdA/CDA1 family)
MKLYWIKTPRLIKKLFPHFVWELPTDKKIVYLTFDDGPTPEITEWILLQLKKFDAKATFFCLGKNIQAEPVLFSKILDDGHVVGNHTFDHLNGWKSNDNEYLQNITKKVSNSVKIENFNNNRIRQIFRPPYGKIRFSQAKKLRALDYKIIMWDILSADFDASVSPEKCYENTTNKIQNGSIVVFHDSEKAFRNLEHALPKALDFLQKKGFVCAAIGNN